MSTSDQQGPLTRKQLREIQRTGSTPVVSADEADAAAAAVSPVPPLPRPEEPSEVVSTPEEAVEAATVPEEPAAEAAPAPEDRSDEVESVDAGAAPLTRRQAREQERIKTASVPVQSGETAPDAEPAEAPLEAPVELVEEVPAFSQGSTDAGDEDDDDDEQVDIAPVSASAVSDTVEFLPAASESTDEIEAEDDAVAAVAELGIDVPAEEDETAAVDDDLLTAAGGSIDADAVEGERPTVSPAFGEGVLADAESRAPLTPSFDELITAGDSAGSHTASNTLIFTPSPGDGALDGPVASTGEILVTGSYELPQGIGSQGHALGTTDGKDVDAVLIDGELPPASSPTPIAASAAVSTIKPAGEVIRPPAPDKGNKLMLTLAIVAGGLALALGVVLIIAFTSNVFSS